MHASPAPHSAPPFDQLLPPLQKTLAQEGYHTPTPIQVQAIPHLLAGRDLIGCAQTGTGKTAAFTLPLLQHLVTHKRPLQPGHPRALILAPTRELAAQIGDSVATYGRGLGVRHWVIFGGVGQHPQVQAIARGLDILVATPGRLIDLMNQGHVNLKAIEVVVLDEADRMLDMGFIPDIRRIISRVPPKRQSLLFSATMLPEVRSLANSFVHDPVTVTISPEQPAVDRIVQKVLFIDKNNKPALLAKLLAGSTIDKVVVFTRTKHGADKVSKKLASAGVSAAAIHGNKGQGARTSALDGFRSGRIRVLVATDIAARGLDVEGVTHVINYDLPNEPETYVHRIGRTARAGAEGDALSFCSAEERDDLRAIEKLLGRAIPVDLEHGFHDSNAQHAKGDAARRPPPGGNRGGGHRGGHRGGPRNDGPKPPHASAKPAAKVGFAFRSRHRD